MRKIARILGVTALLAALLIPASAVLAQPAVVVDVVVSIDAPAEVDPDSDFTAEVDIVNVEDFDSANFDVVFDDTVLRLDDITDGTVDGTAIPVTIWNLVEPGRAIVVVNVLGVPAPGVTGDGTLAVLHFHVIGDAGDESAIDLENGSLGDWMADPIVAADWVGDTVTVAGEAPPPEGVVVSIDAPAEVALDSDFTAEVDIVNVEDFDSADFDVVFDDTVLRLDDVTDGTIDGTVIPVSIWNLVDGRVTVVVNVLGVPAPGVTGDGTLAELHFHVIGDAGDESAIDLENGSLGDWMADPIVAADWVGDTVTVSGEPPPGAVVVRIDAPADEVAPDSDFTAEVDIVNVEDFDAADFDVVFDDTVLRLDDVTAGAVDGTVIPVSIWNLVDGRVTVVVNVLGVPAPGVTGDGTLAVLHFHVIGDAGDESAIDLQNGMLGDYLGVEIEAFWIDGAVTVGVPLPTEFDETFSEFLAEGERDFICTIPAGATELDIDLTTAASPGPDLDLELYDEATCVIGEYGVIDSFPGGRYEGDDFDYSGYDGGEEEITADGPLTRPYDLEVYAYEEGTYTVRVRYDVPPGVDVTPPEITITAPDGTVGEPVTITVTATDDPSGVMMVGLAVWSVIPEGWSWSSPESLSSLAAPQADGEEVWLGYVWSFSDEASLTFAPPWAGTYTIDAWAVDNVGNDTEETTTFEVVE